LVNEVPDIIDARCNYEVLYSYFLAKGTDYV